MWANGPNIPKTHPTIRTMSQAGSLMLGNSNGLIDIVEGFSYYKPNTGQEILAAILHQNNLIGMRSGVLLGL